MTSASRSTTAPWCSPAPVLRSTTTVRASTCGRPRWSRPNDGCLPPCRRGPRSSSIGPADLDDDGRRPASSKATKTIKGPPWFLPAWSCASLLELRCPCARAARALRRHRGPGARTGRPCSSPVGAAIRRSRRGPCRRRPREILYVVEVDKTRLNGELTVSLRTRTARKKGGFAKDKAAAVPVQALELLPDARDRRALPLLQAAATLTGSAASGYQPYAYGYGYGYEARFTSEAADPDRDGRRAHAPAGGDRPPVHAPRAEGRAGAGGVRRRSAVGVRPRAFPRRRGSGERDLRAPPTGRGEPSLVSAPFGDDLGLGAVRAQRRPAAPLRRVRDARVAAWRTGRSRCLPPRRRRSWRASTPSPRFRGWRSRDDLSLEERAGTATPHLKIGPPAPRVVAWGAASDRPTAELSFRYDGLPIALADPRNVIASVSDRRLIRRDRDAEAAAAAKVLEAGFQRAPAQPRGGPRLRTLRRRPRASGRGGSDTGRRRVAGGGRGEAVPASGELCSVGHERGRLVRSAGRDRLRRRFGDAARAATGAATRRHHGPSSVTAASACCPRSG